MKHKKRGTNKVIHFALALSLPTMSFAQQATNQCLTKTETTHHPTTPINKALDWQQSKNLCGGYFLTPASLKAFPNPPPNLSKLHFTIQKLHQENNPKKQEKITCTTNSVFNEPGRIIKANSAAIISKNKKIQQINMPNGCSLQEASKLFKAESGKIDFPTNSFEFYNSVFRLKPRTNIKNQATYWGKAREITYLPNSQGINLVDSTCSTCNPKSASWTLKAKVINFNKKKNKAVIKNAVLKLYHVPILYIPYLSFPIVAGPTTRQTGFLFPSIGYENDHGFTYRQPFYWAPAPNFDTLLTPTYYQKSGFQFNSKIRFLTQNSQGQIYLSLFPHDASFEKFKKDNSGPSKAEEKLGEMSDFRGYFNLNTSFVMSPETNGSITLNYVTDPYYILNYNFANVSTQSTYLMNQINVNYSTKHWRIYNYIQGFQTLHRINESKIENQYRHLPEIDFTGQYDQSMAPFFFDVNGQYNNFSYESDDFEPLTYEKAIGQRLHLKPSIGIRFGRPGWFITPRVSLFQTIYLAKDSAPAKAGQRDSINEEISAPIISIDSGAYFEKKIKLHHKDMWQTLEPRLKYTFIPKRDQKDYPNFDTQLLPFNFNSLFADNAYTGADRVQNTNQLSLGLTSQIFTQSGATKLFEADLGIATYFTPRTVGLGKTDENYDQTFSPAVLQLDYSPTNNLTLSSSAAWDFGENQLNNALVQLKYAQDQRHVFNVSLIQAASYGGPLASLGLARPINDHMQALGFWEYNFHLQRTENGFVGIQYNSCCWSAQLIYNQSFESTETTGATSTNQFNHGIYFQFMLKGLGSFGDSQATDLVKSGLPNFQNTFIT